jgi:NCS1 family nucleobase:cation symporter-1
MAVLEPGRGAAIARRPFTFDELERTTAGALAASDRPLGPLGHLALWGNLGAGLYLLVVGAWLVPALSIPQAVVATVIGAALGAALVSTAVRLGAQENRSGVVLHRGALGESGANLYGLIAVSRHLAWGALQLAIAAELAAALMDRQGIALGRPVWSAVFGALVLLLMLSGPASVVKRWFVTSAVLTLLIAIGFTYSAWSDFGVPAMLKREPAGGWPSMTAGVDLVAAAALIWLPVAIDLGRLGDARRAGVAAFGGLAGMTAWFVLIGALFIPTVDGRDLSGFLLSTPLGALALLLVIVLELDGAFVSLYALASTARAWAPKTDAALPAVVGGAAVLALGAALLDPFDYGDALLLLGAAFAPLLGVLLGARAARRRAGCAAPPAGGGAVAWALGFLLYNWASPLDVPAWTAAMSSLFHGLLRLPFPVDVPGLSATALGFVAAFALAAGPAALRARWTGRKAA